MQNLSNKILLFLSTGFGTGFVPYMPGTIGTLAAVPIFLIVSGNSPIHVALILLLLIVSIPLGDWAEKHFKKKDPGEFVFDEIVGYLIAVLMIPWDVGYTALAGFILFRIFDVAKPPPIRRTQKLTGGFGIVIDDVLAGICANLVLRLLLLVKPYLAGA